MSTTAAKKSPTKTLSSSANGLGPAKHTNKSKTAPTKATEAAMAKFRKAKATSSSRMSPVGRVYEVTSSGEFRAKAVHVAKASSAARIAEALGIKPKRLRDLSLLIETLRNSGRLKTFSK